jgi:hypothetical protein
VLALVAAVIIGTATLAGVLVHGGGREAAVGKTAACRSLMVGGQTYRARQVPADVIANRSLGRGTLYCGRTEVHVTVAVLEGIDPSRAVARPEAPGRIYVAKGVCPHLRGLALLACLRNAPGTS